MNDFEQPEVKTTRLALDDTLPLPVTAPSADEIAWLEQSQTPLPAPQTPAPQRPRLRNSWQLFAGLILSFLILRSLIQNFQIEGESMEPTMQTKQYVLVNKAIYAHLDLNAPLRLWPGNGDVPKKFLYLLHPPERGDIIVFLAPPAAHDLPDKDYIKRVIGVGGDTIRIREGKVWVNEQQLTEEYIGGVETLCDAHCELTVPEGHVFVMGDNRPSSSDSRRWGPLPLEYVIGKAWLSFWPKERWASY
ncbi:signal peptidase I [Herpetosiphon sp. NSE202]|uniref:signal peptidase I n=1 Tax=Herpetosiphon sp. NSE202 TaxID=3351349 RepID=UPI00363E919E